MLLISKTYELITEESAREGEIADSWFDYESAECTIREMAKDLKGLEPSQWPLTADNIEFVWFTYYGEMDMLTGDCENYSLHYSRSNPSRNRKHWLAAVRAAGFKVN